MTKVFIASGRTIGSSSLRIMSTLCALLAIASCASLQSTESNPAEKDYLVTGTTVDELRAQFSSYVGMSFYYISGPFNAKVTDIRPSPANVLTFKSLEIQTNAIPEFLLGQ